MHKKLLYAASAFILLGAIIYLAKDPLMKFAFKTISKDMFVEADVDNFNPGLNVGQGFPEIAALHKGKRIVSVEQFIGDKGMIFIANRSADW